MSNEETIIRVEGVDFRSCFAEVNGLKLHYVIGGKGPLMLLVHGFPQHWYAFRHQLVAFCRDFTVVAVDLRGVNLSGKPQNLWEHGVWPSVEDMRALIAHLGFQSCTLVGHDWGGAVGYSLSLHYPQLLDKLVVISASHPGTFDRELHENPDQIAVGRRWLALRRKDSARTFGANDFASLKSVFNGHEFFTQEDRRIYVEAWRRPGAIDCMLGWYQKEGWGPAEGLTPARGNYVPEISPLTIETTTLVIYGDKDHVILPGNFRGLDGYIPDLTLKCITGGSHWLLDQCPHEINDEMHRFLRRSTLTDEAHLTHG